MNTLLSPEQMSPAPELVNVSNSAEIHQPLLTSQALKAMDSAELARVAGLEHVSDRELLLDAARQVQLQRLGSFISRYANEPTDTVLDKIGERQFREFDPIIDAVDPLPRYEKVLSRLFDLDRVDELEDDEELIDFVPDAPKIIPLNVEPASATIAELVAPVTDTEKPLITLRDLLKPQPVESPLEIAINNQTEQSVLKKMLGSINVLSNKSRQTVKNSLSSLGASLESFRRRIPATKLTAAGLIFVAAYNFLPDIHDTDKGLSERARQAAVADVQTVSVPSVISTIESSPVSTPEVTIAPAEAPQDTVEPSTSMTEQTPETTIDERSLYEMAIDGDAERRELSAQLIAQIDIPSLCLYGIDAYGSQTRDYNNVEVLDYFLEQGQISAELYNQLISSKPPKEAIVQFNDLVNPIYKTYQTEAPQEACESVSYNPAYPPRWERAYIDSSDKDVETENVTNYEPVVDIDWQKPLPGEIGNVVSVGHRTTKSAPLANMDQAKVGDPIIIHTNDGKTHTYIVEGARYIDANKQEYSEAVENYVSPSGNPSTLTLVTCDDGSRQRLIVYAALEA